MRILAINQFYWPDLAPTSVLLTDVCEHMAQRGHTVDVVCSLERYAGSHGTLAEDERHAGVAIHRVKGPGFGRGSLWRRGADALGFQAAATARALQLPRPDVVLVKSTPPLLASVGVALKAARRCRMVYWVQDLYPDVAVALGAVGADAPVTRAARLVARAVVTAADQVVVLGSSMARRVEAQGARAERIRTVDNWQDETDIRPWTQGPHPLRVQWGNADRFCIMYSGNLGLAHDFDTLEAAIRALGHYRNVDVVVVGNGAQKDAVQARMQAAQVANVRFLPLFPREQLPLSLTAPDVHLVSLHAALDGMVVPSKLYGVLAAGVPAAYVGPPGSDGWRVVEGAGAGVCVPNGDVDGLVSALLGLQADPHKRAAMGQRARQAAEGPFSRAAALQKWADVLEA